jgi:hypothetical protein
MPRMQQGIEGGFTSEPHESAFEVHNPQPKQLAAALPQAFQLQSCELEDRVGQG